jgi:hypothetical protein
VDAADFGGGMIVLLIPFPIGEEEFLSTWFKRLSALSKAVDSAWSNVDVDLAASRPVSTADPAAPY